MGWIEFAVALVQLTVLLVNTFMGERVKKQAADAANEKYEIEFDKMVQATIERWKAERKKKSSQARDLDRQMEDDKS